MCCCLHFWRNKFGSMLAQRYVNFYGSKVKHKSQNVNFCYLWLFIGLLCNHWDAVTSAVPMIFYYFSAVDCIFEDLKLGPCFAQRYFKGQRSSKYHKLQHFISLSHQHAMIELWIFDVSSSAYGVSTLLSQSSTSPCISEETNLVPC